MFAPKDVKKMLLQQTRTVFWKKWAAKREYEELKEGIWLELALALLRKKTKEEWTEKHRNVARIFGIGRRLGAEQDFSTSVGRTKVSVQLVTKRKVQKSTFSAIAQNGTRSREIPEAFRKWRHKAKTSKKEWKWQEVSSRTLSVKANGTGTTSV